MKPAANGSPDFTLSISSYIVAEMKALAKQAVATGRIKAYLEAWRLLARRLKKDPLEFGECRYHTMHSEMECRVGSIAPVAVEFLVHEATRIVIVRHVILLGA